MINMKNSTHVLRPIITSFLFAALFFVVSYFFQYLTKDVVIKNQYNINILTEGSYVWGETNAEISDNPTFENFTKEKPISQLPEGKYLRLQYITDTALVDTEFIIITDHTPMKITINNKEVMNNEYNGKYDFVGNKHNSIVIPVNKNKLQVIDVYMFVPFSMEFEVGTKVYTPGSANQSEFQKLYRIPEIKASGAVIIIGFLLFIISVITLFRNKYRMRLGLVGLILILCGADMLIRQINLFSDILASPLWYNSVVILYILTFISMLIGLIFCFNRWTAKVNVIMAVIIAWSSLFFFVNKVEEMKILLCFHLAFGLILTVILTMEYLKLIEKRVEDVTVIMSVLFYIIFVNFYHLSGIIFGMHQFSESIEVCKIIIFCVVLFVVYSKQLKYAFYGVVLKNNQLQSYSRWIDEFTVFLNELYRQTKNEDFFKKAADGIVSIIERNFFLISPGDKKVYVCVAFLENGQYKEIYNKNVRKYNYLDVDNQYRQNPQKTVFYSMEYFDLVFLDKTSDIAAIMHFENIQNGLKPNFINVINTIYTGVFEAFLNINVTNDNEIIQEKIFTNIAKKIESKEYDVNKHLAIVSGITKILSLKLGFTLEEANLISSAANTHDIGKIAIPQQIIDKKGKFTLMERAVIKEHTRLGYSILSQSSGKYIEAAKVIALQHHERYDGQGYMGLVGENIHIYARIVTMADVYEALKAKRAYKEAWTEKQVIKYINENSGKVFDPMVVKAFNESLEEIKALL